MLTAGWIRTRQATGEVRSGSSEMSQNRADEASHGGRVDDHGAAEAATVTIRLLAGPDVGYPAIKQGRFGRSNGKCRFSVSGRWNVKTSRDRGDGSRPFVNRVI